MWRYRPKCIQILHILKVSIHAAFTTHQIYRCHFSLMQVRLYWSLRVFMRCFVHLHSHAGNFTALTCAILWSAGGHRDGDC